MTEITREFYEQLIAEEFDVRDDYSGRFMWGASCLALVGTVKDLAWFASYVTSWLPGYDENDEEDSTAERDYNWLWENIRQDSMGLDYVYYWPEVTVAAREREDGDAA